MAIRKGVFVINGVERLVFGDPEKDSLADVLRKIGLTSVKIGCGTGQCGACTVILDGKPIRACVRKFGKVAEHSVIETLEGLGTAANLHPLQQAFIDEYAFQCGFCTPGIVMAAKGLLLKNPSPTHDEIAEALSGNQCRCISQYHVFNAVESVVQKVQEG